MKIKAITHVEEENEDAGVVINGKRVLFQTDDGDTIFEVTVGNDGRSIKVLAVDHYRLKRVLYSNQLQIEPSVSNSIVIRTTAYGTAKSK